MKNKLLGIALCLSFIISACMSLEKATKKVLDSKSAIEKVGRVWAIDNPCVNDTIQIKGDTLYKPGEIKIIENEVPVFFKDTATKFINFNLDTVISGVHLTIGNGKIKIKVSKQDPDTIQMPSIISYVTDKRALNIANDSLNYYRGLANKKQASIEDLSNTVKSQNGLLRQARIALWAVIALALVIIFRKPIFSLISKF